MMASSVAAQRHCGAASGRRWWCACRACRWCSDAPPAWRHAMLSDGLMGSRLAGEDEVAAGIMDSADDRLAGKQIVPEIDRPKMRDGGTVLGQPALGGIAFAVLLLCPVLRRNELRRQWQDLLVAGCDQGWLPGKSRKYSIAAVGTAPCRALPAFDPLREQKCRSHPARSAPAGSGIGTASAAARLPRSP